MLWQGGRAEAGIEDPTAPTPAVGAEVGGAGEAVGHGGGVGGLAGGAAGGGGGLLPRHQGHLPPLVVGAEHVLHRVVTLKSRGLTWREWVELELASEGKVGDWRPLQEIFT